MHVSNVVLGGDTDIVRMVISSSGLTSYSTSDLSKEAKHFTRPGLDPLSLRPDKVSQVMVVGETVAGKV